jgi:hypothetical protein
MQDHMAQLSPADQTALFEMRKTFGNHYKIWYGMDDWRARRSARLYDIMTADTPGELRQLVEADLAEWKRESGVSS